MPSSLTDTNISDTYKQVLHLSDGLSNTVQKRVRDGDGTESAIKVSTSNAQEAVRGMSVDGKSSADVFDLNTYSSTTKQLGDNLIRAMVDLFYPIGSLYMQGDVIDRDEQPDGTYNNNLRVNNPELRFPGTTWERVSRGRFLAGIGNTDDELTPGGYTRSSIKDPYDGRNKFEYTDATIARADLPDASGSRLRVFAGPDAWWGNLDASINRWDTGDFIQGAVNFRVGYYEHQLTVQEMPSHTHSSSGGGGSESGPYDDTTAAEDRQTVSTDATGGDEPHNNIPPYYGCVIWKRVK